jgi:hypothetical protein
MFFVRIDCRQKIKPKSDRLLEHFPAKPALGLDPGVDTGSPQKMRSLKQKMRSLKEKYRANSDST